MHTDSRPYVANRERFLRRLADDGAAAIVFTARHAVRNHDSEYLFRPHSDFWWLTGFAEPESVLVLLPGRDAGQSVLFLRPRVKEEETWTGLRLGVERAPEALGVDEARPIARLWEDLPELLKGHSRVVYQVGVDEDRDRRVLGIGAKLRRAVRGGVRAPLEWVDPVESLHELRLFKSEHELAVMRRAAAITHEAHVACMATAAPGVNERELDALLEYTYRRRGGTGAAYNHIVAGGANACILHYNENDQPLRDGDLCLIDSGSEVEFYASDVTRTFPVNGRFSEPQRALYQVVLDSQLAAVEHCAPGVTFESVHEVATHKLVEGLVELGLVKESVEQSLQSGSYKTYYMHRTGHWLGLDVHDQGRYHLDGRSRKLEPGMVTTVEPGLYVAPDDDSVDPRWRGIGVRIEDDVLITRDGHENLTASIPKDVDAVEAACAGAELAAARR